MIQVAKQIRFVPVQAAQLVQGDEFAHQPKGVRFAVRQMVAQAAGEVKMRVDMADFGPVKYVKAYPADEVVYRVEFEAVAA